MNKEKRTFNNPILSGFYPDPSICRVNDDYYLITSSFAYFPGVPIFHSKDLVNWEQIGHVLDRPSQLKLDGVGISGGIYAPTIRYHQGVLYVITTNIGNGGNFIVTATDPKGPWSDPHWINDTPGIDPSLFFDDDGKVYYTGTAQAVDAVEFHESEIYCQELDLKTMQLVGERVGIWRGALKNAKYPEGPHLYKIDNYYYLIIAEGGTEHFHAVTIARSKNVFGPYEGYEGNPILTHRHLGKKYPISNPGHADLIETQNGEWWMVALASRPYGGYYKNLGRETFLIPVEWEDGWPIVSAGTGKIENTYVSPNLPYSPVENLSLRDDFDNETLNFTWNSIRTPKDKFYSLSERPGFLRLKLKPKRLVDILDYDTSNSLYDLNEPPSFIGRRQQHINFEVNTLMEFNPQKDFEVAGLALIQNNNFQYRLEYSIINSEKVIRLVKSISESYEDKNGDYKIKNIESTVIEKIFDSDRIYLKINAINQNYSFYYGNSINNMKLLIDNIDGRILSSDIAGGFVGTYIGIFASSNGHATNNIADFDLFDYKVL